MFTIPIPICIIIQTHPNSRAWVHPYLHVSCPKHPACGAYLHACKIFGEEEMDPCMTYACAERWGQQMSMKSLNSSWGKNHQWSQFWKTPVSYGNFISFFYLYIWPPQENLPDHHCELICQNHHLPVFLSEDILVLTVLRIPQIWRILISNQMCPKQNCHKYSNGKSLPFFYHHFS